MRREKKLNPMIADLDTTKLLVSIFGHKILKDIKITINGGDKKDADRR